MPLENKDAEKILEICYRLGWHIACAESLTGGLLADAFVSVPGASKSFVGSLVIYNSLEKETIYMIENGKVQTYTMSYANYISVELKKIVFN